MSGFLPDIASWALRGGAGAPRDSSEEDEDEDMDQNNVDNGDTAGVSVNELPPVPTTAEELRAQRLARLEALSTKNTVDPTAMEVESEALTKGKESKHVLENDATSKKLAVSTEKGGGMSPMIPSDKNRTVKKAKSTEDMSSPDDLSRKLQRKKEVLLSRCLHVQLIGGGTYHIEGPGMTLLDTGSAEISVATIAEILATRLSVEPTLTGNNTIDQQHSNLVIAYLGAAYNRTMDELRSLNSTKKVSNDQAGLVELVQEIQKQTVAYAATCLVEPSIFPVMAKNVALQLGNALLVAVTTGAAESNITLGGVNSFYYQVMDELVQQQSVDYLNKTVTTMVKFILSLLAQSDSILDSISVPSSGSVIGPTMAVAALTSICLHKNAAAALTELDTFLLPAAGTSEAVALIRPPIPTGMNPLQQLLGNSDAHRPFKARSGPGLEKLTLLGSILRVGAPRSLNNSAFPVHSVLRQTPATVETVTRGQRQQVTIHQDACFQFIKTLLKNGGPPARVKLLAWFSDALLVNTGASALRPDHSKVSSINLLLNVSVMLLKLCDPFTADDSKQHLIDAVFVSTPQAHGGVFCTTGDDAVPRLGAALTDASETVAPYNPKNAFIPNIFFYCARSLHLSIAPYLRLHEYLLRNINHFHNEITNANRDIHTDPHFASLISRQRSEEVSLFQEEMMEPTLKFCNFVSKVMNDMDDTTVATMPEEFVSDICDILLAVAVLKPQLLAGHEFRHVFKLSVKLLSPKYASIVRNYNLRAQLGDVLHEIFLPLSPGSRREVPASVSIDPLAGGQPYLLSDSFAQKTLAPSLLLLYGEVEHTGYYEKMSHRAKIASLIKYLWDSSEHRPAFRRITQNKTSFIKFANGIMNETNFLIAIVMQKLPEIREAQERMNNPMEWGALSEEEQRRVSSRLADNEREVKSALPLSNKTLQMFGYLNTDPDIRTLFLLDELCARLVTMLVHVLTKLVGSKGLDLKVDNPEQLEFRPKEMLRDLCAIFALFASSDVFQDECAKSGCDSNLLRSAVKTCRRLNLLEAESMEAFHNLPDIVEAAASRVALEEALLVDAPDEFLDEIMSTYMKDPVILPSGHYVDRSTITQHLLNDPIDPFNREPLTVDQIQPAVELKARMETWLAEKRAEKSAES